MTTINYIGKNFKTKSACINALMSFRDLQIDKFQDISHTKIFDTWADKELKQLQIICSCIYILLDDGKVWDAVDYYRTEILGLNDILSNRANTAFKFQ